MIEQEVYMIQAHKLLLKSITSHSRIFGFGSATAPLSWRVRSLGLQSGDAGRGDLLVLVRHDTGNADPAHTLVVVQYRKSALDGKAIGEDQHDRALLGHVLKRFGRTPG